MADPLSDINFVNGQADLLFNSAFTKYGLAPNPQLAIGAIQTGATTDVAGAINNSDPNTDNSISSLAAAGPVDGSFGAARNTVHSSTSDPYTIDWGAYQKSMADLHKSNPDSYAVFADVNGVPLANVGYADGTVSWASKDPKQAKAWQQHLIDSGVFKSDLFGSNGRTSADGVWGASDTQALYLYLAQMGQADALYSRDPAIQSKATTSVQELYKRAGLDWSPDAIKSAVGNDPKAQRNYQDQVFQAWLAGHPIKPNDGGQLQDRIAEYADLYGKNSLPQSVQDMGSPGILGKLAGIPAGIEHFLSTGPVLDRQEKEQQQAKDIAAGGAWAAVQGYFATPEVTSLALQAKLTTEEQAQLAPLVAKVASGQDYATEVGNWWSHQTTKLQLLPLYAVGDFVSPQNKESANPFDNLARAWSGATAHEDNFMVGLAGQQWVSDHSAAAQIINLTSSFLDPTVFVGAAGRLASAGSLLKGLETASAMSKDDLIANGVSRTALSKIAYVLRPGDTVHRLMQQAIPPLLRNLTAVDDRIRLLGLGSADESAVTALMTHLHDASGAFNSKLTDTQINDLITQHGISDYMNAGKTWYNFHQSLNALSPNVLRRMDTNLLTRAKIAGAWDFGHQAMHFGTDMMSAVDKIRHEGMLLGVPMPEVDKIVNGMFADPTKATDLADHFYKKLLPEYAPKGLLDQIQKARSTKWDGLMPESIGHQFAVDPRGPASPTGTGEFSTAPIKVPAQLQGAVDAISNAKKILAEDFMNGVEHWQVTKRGFQMGGSAEANQAIVDAFKADPVNAGIAKKFEADLAEIQRELADLIGTSQSEKGAPFLHQQLAQLYHAPFSTWEAVVAKVPALRASEQMQAMIKADAVMDMWKLFTLAKPSSALRALIGDDTLRGAVTLAFAGSPTAAARMSLTKHVLDSPKTTLDAGMTLLMPVAKGLWGVGSHLRSVVKRKLMDTTGMTAAQIDAAVNSRYDKWLAKLGPLAPEMHKLIERSADRAGFHPLGPTQPGHTQSAAWWIRSIANGPGKAWAATFDSKGANAALQELVDSRLKDLSPENLKLQIAKGAKPEDIVAMKDAEDHGTQAQAIQKLLDQVDASMPRYLRGPRTGQPKYAAIQYRNVYGSLPTQMPKGTEIPGNTGAYRDRVLARIKYHQDMSTNFPQIVIEQARKEHDFYQRFMGLPEIRDMVSKGSMDHKGFDKLVRDPVSRAHIPWVVAMQDTAQARKFQSGFKRWFEAPAQLSMDHVFRPIITAGRADMAERVQAWWRSYLGEMHKDDPDVWTKDRIEAKSQGIMQDWMRNNTYQGARNVASYALRNVFPFSGSTLNQNRFWLNTFKAHPWAAGVAAKLAIDIDAKSKSKEWEVNIPNPLGWAHVGGDVMSINPMGFTFVGSEGMGSFIPGMGPMAMPFAMIASQDAHIRKVFDAVPGWGTYLPQTASLGAAVGGFVPSYIQKGVEAGALAAGLDQKMVPGAEQKIADKTRELEAQGIRPTEDQVRRQVEIELAAGGAASWVLPVQPSINNPTMTLMKRASADESRGVSLAALRADPKYASIAPFLEYRDQATDPKRKDELVQEFPQLLAWGASVHETKGTTNMPKPTSFQDYTQLADTGSEHYMSAGEIDGAINQAFQTSQFFQAYDTAYTPQRDAFLADNNVSTSSAEYKAFKAQTLDPIMAQLKQNLPLGYNKFIGGSTALSDQQTSKAISSLNTYYHLPSTAEFNTQGVNNWRTVMDLVNQTTANIVDAKAQGASAADLQALSQNFHDMLTQTFASDPAFLDEIGLRYHWSSWRNFLTAQANQQIQANQ